VAEPLGFVPKEDLPELMKAILATQRDHGNREVRANARMKYLVHSLGIDNFRKLVESYFGKKIGPLVPLPAWRMVDWMGWHEQGDGKLFLGVVVEQGRVRDFDNGLKLKTAIRTIVDKYDLDTRLTADQNIVLCGIDPKDKDDIDAILLSHGVKPLAEVDMMTRKSIACPAFPLCGLAQAEAERRMPDFNERVNALLDKMGMPGESFVMRMTGCPNGCARPYMAELSFVGQGPDLYQVWMGGSSQLDGRTGFRFKDKMKQAELEQEIEPILWMWKTQRSSQAERLGDFLHRVGLAKIEEFVAQYKPGTAFDNVQVETLYTGPVVAAAGGGAKGARLTSGPRKQQVRVTDELHMMLKSKADSTGQPISDLVEELIMRGLQ
jgi:sulfite reductase (ferredoxin)